MSNVILTYIVSYDLIAKHVVTLTPNVSANPKLCCLHVIIEN